MLHLTRCVYFGMSFIEPSQVLVIYFTLISCFLSTLVLSYICGLLLPGKICT